ncbi:MAG: hypothetical protein WA687_07770 [Solirubrobacterales bacterium]
MGIDPHTAKVLFIVGSAAFELAGLGFVAKEIWGARQNAREVLGGKSGAELKLRVGSELSGSYRIESGDTPMTWERLQRIEQIQDEQHRETRRLIGQLADQLQGDIDKVRNEALKAAAERDSALRT